MNISLHFSSSFSLHSKPLIWRALHARPERSAGSLVSLMPTGTAGFFAAASGSPVTFWAHRRSNLPRWTAVATHPAPPSVDPFTYPHLTAVSEIAKFGSAAKRKEWGVPRTETIWIRNVEVAETVQDELDDAIADGVIDRAEFARIRPLIRQNMRNQIEAQHVISLTVSYLGVGEKSRANTFSQVSRKQRQNAQAGFPTLPIEEGGLYDDAA